MGETIRIKSRFDGFELSAYRAPHGDARRGGLVLAHEIFGVTAHIRGICDRFAEDGYEVLAPSFFDRAAPGYEAGYEAVQEGVRLSTEASWDQVRGDLQGAIDALEPPVFVMGFCWGGTAAWLAACRCDGVAAASAFYGGRIRELIDETPKVPVILHYGREDASIPPAEIEAVRERHPDVPVHVYAGGHGFFSETRSGYAADAARLARLRTLALFTRQAGGRGEI